MWGGWMLASSERCWKVFGVLVEGSSGGHFGCCWEYQEGKEKLLSLWKHRHIPGWSESPLHNIYYWDVCYQLLLFAWVRKLDFDKSSDDAAGMLLGRAGKEGSEVGETSFQCGCCCYTGIAICDICSVGAEAWPFAETDGWWGGWCRLKARVFYCLLDDVSSICLVRECRELYRKALWHKCDWFYPTPVGARPV